MFLLVYVDDIILMRNDSVVMNGLFARLSTTLKIRDLGSLRFFLGVEIVPIDGGGVLFFPSSSIWGIF